LQGYDRDLTGPDAVVRKRAVPQID